MEMFVLLNQYHMNKNQFIKTQLKNKIILIAVAPLKKSVSQLVSQSVGQSVGRSVGWSVGWLVGRSVGRSVGWSVNRSVGPSVRQSVSQSVSNSKLPFLKFTAPDTSTDLFFLQGCCPFLLVKILNRISLPKYFFMLLSPCSFFF